MVATHTPVAQQVVTTFETEYRVVLHGTVPQVGKWGPDRESAIANARFLRERGRIAIVECRQVTKTFEPWVEVEA